MGHHLGRRRREVFTSAPNTLSEHCGARSEPLHDHARGYYAGNRLDAVSHAMEAVWNRNHMPPDRMALIAISEIYANLQQAIEQPTNVALRERINRFIDRRLRDGNDANCRRPFNFLSFYQYDMPHGLRFTPAEVVRHNAEADGQRLLPIAQALDCSVDSIGKTIERWFVELDLQHEAQYVTPDVTDEMATV